MNAISRMVIASRRVSSCAFLGKEVGALPTDGTLLAFLVTTTLVSMRRNCLT